MSRYINVAVPLPMRKLFTYTVPDDCIIERGFRVVVPFGTKSYTAIVVEVDVPSRPDAKPVEEILDDTEPAIIPSILDLTRWIAEYYLCSWGEALAAALPREFSQHTVLRVQLRRVPTAEERELMQRRAPKRAQLLDVLERQSGAVTIGFLERQIQTGSITAQLEALERDGYIQLVSTLETTHKPKTERCLVLSTELRTNPSHLERVLLDLESSAPKQAQALAVIAHTAGSIPIPWHQARTAAGVGDSVLRALVEKGYLGVQHIERPQAIESNPASLAPTQREIDLQLNDEQKHAVERITEAITANRAKTFLLHGVTGSGKTLVYMHAISQVLADGKTALVLVPEISLTPQLIDRFTAAFGGTVVAFHSRMSPSERYSAWRAIRNGQVRVVLGPRSAVFTPLTMLGIIIVDEEHESSYKQESPAPRYNGRDTAIMRGHLENAVVVLGSATPSLESMYNAATGRYHLLELAARADGAQLPVIRVINTIEERKHQRMSGRFSKTLLDAIIARLRRREGIILLHNRRGFAPRLECPECGHVPHCTQCNVALTYHKHTNQLRCHYCGRSYRVPEHCPSCGNPTLVAIGAGTQRIEDELDALLKQNSAQAVIARVDSDTTAGKGSLRRILHDFTNGRIDILVGTQMIAKGLDIGRVTLVGVINADMQLYIPDFRAGEWTFQLLTQVAGRAGRRAEQPGEVIIQTAHPEHTAIQCARLYRYDLFYSDELQERREANYPPFTRLVLIEFSGTDVEQVERHAHAFAHYMPRGVAAVSTLGPARPSLDRIQGKYRRILLVKGDRQLDPNGVELRRAILTAWAAYNEQHATQSVRLTIDVDTQSSL